MRTVLDASVAVKLVLREPDSDLAALAVRSAADLVAPDHLFIEVASALLKAARNDDFDALHVEAAVETIGRLMDQVWPARSLLDEAIAIARELRHPVYDCLYVALGRRLSAPVLTADTDLVRACDRTAAFAGVAILLDRAIAPP